MSDYHTRIRDTICYSADTCTLDPACPFVGGCRAVEARDDDWEQANPAIGRAVDGDVLGRWFDEMMPQALRWFDEAALTEGEGHLVPPPFLDSVRKMSATMLVPNELLMDQGVIPDTREHEPVPWRSRLRWKIRDARTRLGQIAYRVAAGEWPPDGEDDW
jgi:hypothetical protein